MLNSSIILGLIFILSQQLIGGTSSDSVLYLDEVLEIARQQNPQLEAMIQGRDAAQARIPQAGSLPDPQLTLGIMSLPTDSYAFNQEPMTQKTLGISQAFPFFGKLGLRKDVAVSEYRIMNQQLQQASLMLVRDVKYAFFQMAFLHRTMEILKQNRILLHDLVEITRTRYAVGKGIQQDLLKSQLQLLRLEQQLIETQEQYQNASSGLNVLLNRLPQEPLAFPEQPPLNELALDIKQLQEIALTNSPSLMISGYNVDLNQAQVNLAWREYWPDIMLSLSYGQRERMPDFISGMISVNIPLYFASKQSKNVQEKKYQLQGSQSTYIDIKNKLYMQVKNLVDEATKNRELIILYRDQILPHANQALNSSIAAYQNDRIDFLTVIDNQVTLLNYEIEMERIIAEYHQSFAELEMVCGKSLTELSK